MFSLICSCGTKKESVQNKKYVLNTEIKSSCLENDSLIIFQLKNISENSKYVLSSYLNNRFTYNKNFYRYSDDKLLASFLPIVEHIGTIKTDVLIIDDSSIYKDKQVVYSFFEIKPNEMIEIELDKNILQEKFMLKKEDKLQVKLAFYDNVNLLETRGIEYDVEGRELFLVQAQDYKVLTLECRENPN